jgi:predicted RNase H-like HicB family nuclease
MDPREHDYPVLIEPVASQDGGFRAWVPDLPGCVCEADTAAEALADIEDAITQWLAEARRAGRTIPAPARSRVTAAWTSD